MRVQDTSVLEVDGFEERATKPLHDRAGNLVSKSLRVHDCAAIKCLDHAYHFDLAFLDRNFGAGGNMPILLDSAGNPETVVLSRFVFTPDEPFCRRLEDAAQALVLEIL